jgi:hypothetical protein
VNVVGPKTPLGLGNAQPFPALGKAVVGMLAVSGLSATWAPWVRL